MWDDDFTDSRTDIIIVALADENSKFVYQKQFPFQFVPPTCGAAIIPFGSLAISFQLK